MNQISHIWNKRALAVAVIAAAATSASAQLHENISVEGKYVPDVIRIDRINTFPKAFRQTLSTSPLDYEQVGVATSFTPSLMVMPATGWRSYREISDNRGYLELGAGSWLNSTLSAGYRFIDNSSTLVGVRLQHNSTSLWKPEMAEWMKNVKQERYDDAIGVYASHVFKGYGRLDAALDYHVGYFNYYGFVGHDYGFVDSPVDMTKDYKAPTQTINDVAFRADWRSLVTPSAATSYYGTLRLRHFAYRSLPMGAMENDEILKGSRETNLGLEGGIRLPWESGSSIELDARLDMVFVSGEKKIESAIPGQGYNANPFPVADDYGMLTLSPYYRFSKGLLDIRLGADVDLAFNAGEDGNRYSFFHIAPDVRFALQTGQVGLYLNFQGGSELNTLSHLHELDYYSMPYVISTRPSFTPLDASFGINLGPFSGFSMGVEAKWRSTKNVPLGGWYMAALNNGMMPLDALEPSVKGTGNVLYVGDTEGINLHGVSVGGHMSYEYGDLFSIYAGASYQPQDGKKGFFNGYDRAKITGNVKVSVKPIKPLSVSAGFDFKGKRAIYVKSVGSVADGGTVINGDNMTLHKLPLEDLSLLNLSATWSFSPSVSIWAGADNILNRKVDVLPVQPMQGIVFTGGFKWIF